MNKNKKYTRKENKFIIETYEKLKDEQTKKSEVNAIIAQELGRPIQGLEKHVQILQRIGKIPRCNKKPKVAVSVRIDPPMSLKPEPYSIKMPEPPKEHIFDANFFLALALIIVVILQIMEYLNA